MNYQSEIQLGKRYRDTDTGFIGTAVNIGFFEHGCERVSLKGMNTNGEIVDYAFDAPEVELIMANGEGKQIKLIEHKTGGPHDRKPMRRR